MTLKSFQLRLLYLFMRVMSILSVVFFFLGVGYFTKEDNLNFAININVPHLDRNIPVALAHGVYIFTTHTLCWRLQFILRFSTMLPSSDY